jgi:hypothetical protein
MYALNTDTSEITRDLDGAVCTVGTGFYDEYVAWCNEGNLPKAIANQVVVYNVITPSHIIKCLTKSEVSALINSPDSVVKYIVVIAFTSDAIDITDEFINSINYLVSLKLISQVSADKILG